VTKVNFSPTLRVLDPFLLSSLVMYSRNW